MPDASRSAICSTPAQSGGLLHQCLHSSLVPALQIANLMSGMHSCTAEGGCGGVVGGGGGGGEAERLVLQVVKPGGFG